MIDQQIPDWEQDSSLDVLLALSVLSRRILDQVPREEGFGAPDDPALDFLLGLVVVSQKMNHLLQVPEAPPLPPAPAWPTDLLR